MPVVISNDYYHVVNGTPSGNINGSNTLFATASKFKTNSLKVYLNGVLQIQFTHYYERQGNQSFTMISIPRTNDTLQVDYDISFED